MKYTVESGGVGEFRTLYSCEHPWFSKPGRQPHRFSTPFFPNHDHTSTMLQCGGYVALVQLEIVYFQ